MMRKILKIINEIMFWLSIAFAAAHLIWCGAAARFDQSLLLNVIPYGLPILVFALARRELRRASPRLALTDTVFGALFSLCYLAMAIHVTVAGGIGDFINVYFNIPVLYTIPIALLGIVWLIVRTKPKADTAVVEKVLYALPLVALGAMIVHCGILCIVEWVRNSANGGFPATSFPWWTMPLLWGIAYLALAGLLFALYAVYRGVQKRKEKQNRKTA